MEQLPNQKKQILFFLVAFFIIVITAIWLFLFKYELNLPWQKKDPALTNGLQEIKGSLSNLTKEIGEVLQQPGVVNNNQIILTNEEIQELKEKIQGQLSNLNNQQATSTIMPNSNQ